MAEGSNKTKSDIVQCLLDVLCDDKLMALSSGYHRYLADLVCMTMSDSNSSAVITGPGYQHMPIFQAVQDFGGRQFVLKSEINRQCVYSVQKGCSVLEDPSVQYSSGNPVLMYAAPAELYNKKYGKDKLVLHISSRTYSLIHREDYGLPFKESVVVRLDANRIPKFHLSSQKFLAQVDMVSKSREKQLLLFEFPPIPLDVRCIDVTEDDDIADNLLMTPEAEGQSHWYECQKASTASLRVLPVFELTQWPKMAIRWASRSRLWPPNAIVREVMTCVTYVVPQTNKCVDTPSEKSDVSPENAEEDFKYSEDLLWSLDFNEAESILLSKLGPGVKKIFFLLQVLLRQNPAFYSLLKCTFLWCLEQHGPDLGPNNGSPTAKLLIVLSKLEDFLKSKCIPHYFLEDTNLLNEDLLEHCDELLHCVCLLQEDIVKKLLASTGFSALKNTMNDSDDNNNILKQVKDLLYYNMKQALLTTIGHNTNLLCIQLYQKLHSCTVASRSITLHKQVLANMTTRDDPNNPQVYGELQSTLLDFIHSSLGTMFLVHGLQSYFSSEKNVFFEKSQEQFSLIRDQDHPVHKIRSAIILVKRQHHQQVVDTLSSVLGRLLEAKLHKHTLIPNITFIRKNTQLTGSRDSAELTSDVPFHEALDKVATDAMRSVDFLAMKLEKVAMPSDITRNLSLAHYQLLGYTKYPVAVLDATIVCGYILAQAHSALGQYAKATEILQKVEDFCLQDEADFNEKRGCVYLNVIADAYIQARNPDQGKYLLQRSLRIMSNPRNPGRWSMLSVKTRRAREYVMGGMGVAMATAVAAVAINFLLTKK